MIPEKSFVPFVKSLGDFGFKCRENRPVWFCNGTFADYAKLPSININLMINTKGQSANIVMPREAYMKFDDET